VIPAICAIDSWLVVGLALCIRGTRGKDTLRTYPSFRVPTTAAPKMNESFVHMAHVSSGHACAQDGYLKRPHLTIIDEDMRWDIG
jgi:hypothetical protein